MIRSWCDAILPYPLPHRRLGQGATVLGQLFFSLVPGKGPFYQFRNKSLTDLFEACYNTRQSQQIVETIFLPTVFAHQISRLLGRLFCAAPGTALDDAGTVRSDLIRYQRLIFVPVLAKSGKDFFINLGLKA